MSKPSKSSPSKVIGFYDDSEPEEGTHTSVKKLSNNRGMSTRTSKPYIPTLIHRVNHDANLNVSENALSPLETNERVNNPSHHAIGIDEGVILKSVKYICYDCRRKFRDADHLARHKRISIRHLNQISSTKD